jgi:cytochrome b involved in lipid metabolism
MLSYALLMALLYGTENKNLKTILAIATALSMLKGKSAKRVRRPRSRRARRILAERVVERKNNSEDTLQKVEVFLPIIAKVLEAVTVKVKENRDEEKANSQANPKVSKINVNNSTKKKRSYDQTLGNTECEDNAECEDNVAYEDNVPYEDNTSFEKVTEAPLANSIAKDEETNNLEKNQLTEEKAKENTDVAYEGKVYKVDSYPISYGDEDITETIKDIFHGVNVTLMLNNGQTTNGEVIGAYKGILILRNTGVLNYIRGEAITSFY